MNESNRMKSGRSSELRDDSRCENNTPVENTYSEVLEMKKNCVREPSHSPKMRDGALVDNQTPAYTDQNEVSKMKKNQMKNTTPLIFISKGTAVNIDGTWMCLAHDATARIIEDDAIQMSSEDRESQQDQDESLAEQSQPAQKEDGRLLGEILEQYPQGFYYDDVVDELEEMELVGITTSAELNGYIADPSENGRI